MKGFLRTAISLFAVLLFTASLFAQAPPRNGACFYRETAYRGNSFCANSGDALDNLPSGFNDAIRSVRIFGNAQVRAFNDNRFNGASITISSDVPDLHMIQMATDRSRNWSERISSLQVIGGYGGDRDRDRDRDQDRDHDRDRDRYGYPQWGRGAMPGNGGACFFDQPNFRGRSFCASLGQSFNNLPSGFNDRIQSIQVRGNAEVLIFNDNNFGGVAARTRRDVADLRAWRIPDDPSRNWGGRISSIRVDAPGRGRWNNNGGYGDGDRDDRYHDRDDDRDRQQPNDGNLFRCNSRPGDRQMFCDTRGNIRDADLVNSYGTCRKYENWGVANGRLWTANGCSGDFQVRR